MNNISFQAHVVKNKIPIRVVANNTETNASIVELDITSLGNMKVINSVANRFQKALEGRENEYNYASDARTRFNRLCNVPSRRENEYFYLFTTEELNEGEEFDTMNADDVIGVAQVNNDLDATSCEIKYFNIDPKTNHNSENRQYKETGKSFLTGLHDIVHKDTIVDPDKNAVEFYEKLKYEALPSGKLIHKYRPTSPSE